VRAHALAQLGSREKPPEPSAGIADSSQSAKTSGGVGGEARGCYDGAKKVRGRKRHLLVDTEGLVLRAKVHSAKVPDQDGIKLLLKAARERLPRLSHLWVDAGVTRAGQRAGRAGTRSECRSCASHTEADTSEDCKDLGTGVVGEGGLADRLAEAASTTTSGL
jgi:DDE family transposase